MSIETFTSRKGSTAEMSVREDTVDFDVCMSSIHEDEYGLGPRAELTGVALDIGAHIGAVTMALALDNPNLRVIAVEIVPENAEALRDNAIRNGVSDRVTVVEKAAGGPDELSRTCYMHHRSHPVAPLEYVRKHRHIGNSFWSEAYGGAFDSEAVEMEVVSLSALTEGIDEVSFLKIDAEGAEWAFLRDPAVSKVQTMVGEFHWDYAPQGDSATHRKGAKPYKRAKTAQEELHRLLDATHVVTVADHPTIGLFEATRR